MPKNLADLLQMATTVDQHVTLVLKFSSCRIFDSKLPKPFLLIPGRTCDCMPELDIFSQVVLFHNSTKILPDLLRSRIVL
jgi:hypothetical protein